MRMGSVQQEREREGEGGSGGAVGGEGWIVILARTLAGQCGDRGEGVKISDGQIFPLPCRHLAYPSAPFALNSSQVGQGHGEVPQGAPEGFLQCCTQIQPRRASQSAKGSPAAGHGMGAGGLS